MWLAGGQGRYIQSLGQRILSLTLDSMPPRLSADQTADSSRQSADQTAHAPQPSADQTADSSNQSADRTADSSIQSVDQTADKSIQSAKYSNQIEAVSVEITWEKPEVIIIYMKLKLKIVNN